MRGSGPGDGADASGIDCQLLTMEGLEAIGHDFNAASIGQRIVHIHVRHCDIASNAGPCLTADLRHRPLQGRRPGRQDPGGGTGRPVVTQGIDDATAGAAMGGEGEGHAQSAEQRDAELRAGHS